MSISSDYDEYNSLSRKSFGLFPLRWRIRKFVFQVVSEPIFDFFILCLIFANAIMFAMYDPLHPTSPVNLAIIDTNVFFLICYTIEMLLKMFAFGVYWESKHRTYFRSGWNVLDFFVVFLGWLSISLQSLSSTTSFASAARVVRVLRVFQYVNFSPSLRWVTRALIRAIPQLLTGGVLFLFFCVILLHN